ncbi:MAG: PhoH family protein [Phycisphaerae bacterium]
MRCGYPQQDARKLPPTELGPERLGFSSDNVLFTAVLLNITLEQPEKKLALFGVADRNLRMIRDALGVSLVSRNDELKVSGDRQQVERAALVLDLLQRQLRRRPAISPEDVTAAISEAAVDEAAPGGTQEVSARIETFARGRSVEAKTAGQETYIRAIFEHDLTFCIGPAGTGKTYLAVAAATQMLKRGRVKRLVLARPAVEAGERLGFLPGDLQAKVNPYLRPLFDALNDMMDFEQVKRFMMNDVIEVVPLAFMRGRTLNDACVIMDEAQNTTRSQMLMFLTRLGNDSKMIVTGDISQIDLDPRDPSGLIDALERLGGVEGVARVELDRADIVRHPLVNRIVNAYGSGETRPAR